MLKKSMVTETLKLLLAKRFVFAIEGAPSHYYNLKKPDEVGSHHFLVRASHQEASIIKLVFS